MTGMPYHASVGKDTASRSEPSPIEHLINHCSSLTTPVLSKTLDLRIRNLGSIFERALAHSPSTSARIVTFHDPVPVDVATIRYVDVEHDHHQYDYDAILRFFLKRAEATNPGAQRVVITSERANLPSLDSTTVLIRLPLDSHQIMFERAVAVAALINSTAHDRPTALLDTDAFLHGALEHVFAFPFSIAVTERACENFYMPLNEGVMFARADNPHAPAFFRNVLATYERLTFDSDVRSYYGDIRRWRGGQLALNAVADAWRERGWSASRGLLRLPCDVFNVPVDPDDADAERGWPGKIVLHLKGDKKFRFAQFYSRFAKFSNISCGMEFPSL